MAAITETIQGATAAERVGSSFAHVLDQFSFVYHRDSVLLNPAHASMEHYTRLISSATQADLQSLDETFWTVWAGTLIFEAKYGDEYRRNALAQAFRNGLTDTETQLTAAAHLWAYGGRGSGRRIALTLLMAEVSIADKQEFVRTVADLARDIDPEADAKYLLACYDAESPTL